MNNKKLVGLIMTIAGIVGIFVIFIMSYFYLQNNVVDLGAIFPKYLMGPNGKSSPTILGAMEAGGFTSIFFVSVIISIGGIYLISKSEKP